LWILLPLKTFPKPPSPRKFCLLVLSVVNQYYPMECSPSYSLRSYILEIVPPPPRSNVMNLVGCGCSLSITSSYLTSSVFFISYYGSRGIFPLLSGVMYLLDIFRIAYYELAFSILYLCSCFPSFARLTCVYDDL
jgi:hypothetical protein